LKKEVKTLKDNEKKSSKTITLQKVAFDRMRGNHSKSFSLGRNGGETEFFESCPITLKWGKNIGSGSFGVVYLTGDEQHVVKFFKSDQTNQSSRETNEIVMNTSFYKEYLMMIYLRSYEVTLSS